MQPHPKFKRKGDDIVSSLSLKLSEALLGCSRAVETVLGSRMVTVPPCTQSGAQLVLQSAGAPRLGGAGRGNHVLDVLVAAPRQLTPDQLKLVEQLRDSGM